MAYLYARWLSPYGQGYYEQYVDNGSSSRQIYGCHTCWKCERFVLHLLLGLLFDKWWTVPCCLSWRQLREPELRCLVHECEWRCFGFAHECRFASGLPRSNRESAERYSVQVGQRGGVSVKRERSDKAKERRWRIIPTPF